MAVPKIKFQIAHADRLPAALLLIFFVFLCICGGASREDVAGQAIIRGAAVLLMIVQILAGGLPHFGRYKACFVLLGCMALLAVVQIVPLPPSIWTSLPGRGIIAQAPLATVPWRPLSLVPDAGLNALFSLLVPLCVLVLASALDPKVLRYSRYLLIGAVVISAMVALMQAAGNASSFGLINGSTDDYSGVFANRNHQALFLAIGIAIACFIGFDRGGSWRSRSLWLAACIVMMLAVSILVTGSRSGLILGGVAILAGLPLASFRLPNARIGPRDLLIWTGIAALVVAATVATSIYFGRAQALDRATTLSLDEEFRWVALPTVWQIAKTYFPLGAGLGSFDAVFRMAEPFSLLKPTYFNHAHDDLLETVIETGIAGPAIFLAAMIWVARRAISTVVGRSGEVRLARLGGLLVFLTVLASVSDYPARTPMIMATLALAGCWLTQAASRRRSETFDALPVSGKPL